tara:strand:+ start:886 stop:1527 length:642 start_codon:yes stop_codon:yes gene_type:complete
MRGRGNGARRSGPSRTQHFDSNGPDLKVRGNAQQIVDKYQALAQEAMTAGNPVMAENYYQHAEHYLRVLGAAAENRPDNNRGDQQNADSQESGQNSGQSSGQDSDQENAARGNRNRNAPAAEDKAARVSTGKASNGNGHQADASADTDDGATMASEADKDVVVPDSGADAGSDTDRGDAKEESRNPADIAARASRPRRRRPRPAPTEAGDAVS